MYVYGKKNKLQRLINPVLLNEIPSNLLSRGFLWILTAKKILVKFAPPEPPIFDMRKNLHFYDIVSWQPHLGLVLLDEFCLAFFAFWSPLWPYQATNIYIYIYIYISLVTG